MEELELEKVVTKELLKAFGDKCHNLFKYNPYHLTSSIKGRWIKVNTVIPYNELDKVYLGILGISTDNLNGNKKSINSIFYLDSSEYSHGFNFGNDTIESVVFLNADGYLNIWLRLVNGRQTRETIIDVLAYLNNETHDLVRTPINGGEYTNSVEEPSTYVQIAIEDCYPFNSNKIGTISILVSEETRFTIVENINGLSEVSSTYPETDKFYKIYESEKTNKLSHGLLFQYDWENPINSEDDPVNITNGILEENEIVKIPVPDIFTSGATSEGFASKVKVENGLVTEVDYSSDISNASTSVIGGIKLFKDSNADNTNLLQESQFPVVLDSGNRAYVLVPVSDVHRFYDFSDVPAELKKAGYIVQYIGQTTEDYTKGYFYQYTPTNFDVVSPIVNTKWIFSDSAAATGLAIADYNFELDYLITSGDLVLQMQELIGLTSIDDNTMFTILQNNVELTELSYADIKRYFKVERHPNWLASLTDPDCTLTLSIPANSESWKLKNVQPLLKVGSPLVYKGLATWQQLQELREKEIGDFYTVTDKDNQEYFWNGESWEFMGKVINVPTYSEGDGIDITASGNNNIVSVKYDNSTIKKDNSGNLYVDGELTDTQADWNQESSSAKDYIKNKPTDVSAFNNDAGYLTAHLTLKTINNESLVGSGNIDTTLEILEFFTATGTLTDEQYNKLIGNNCAVKYENRIYQKAYTSTTGFDYRYTGHVLTNEDVTYYYFTVSSNTKNYTFGTNVDQRARVSANQTLSNDAVTTPLQNLVIGFNAYTIPDNNSASLLVSDISNKKINTSETTGSYLKFTGGTDKFTITDKDNNSFDVPITVTDDKQKITSSSNKFFITGVEPVSDSIPSNSAEGVATSNLYFLESMLHLDRNIEHPFETEILTSEPQQSINVTSNSKYKFIKANFTGYITLNVSRTAVEEEDTVRNIVYRISNILPVSPESGHVTVKITSSNLVSLANMYTNSITTSTGVSLNPGETLELVFTFWGPDNVTFNGGKNV